MARTSFGNSSSSLGNVYHLYFIYTFEASLESLSSFVDGRFARDCIIYVTVFNIIEEIRQNLQQLLSSSPPPPFTQKALKPLLKSVSAEGSGSNHGSLSSSRRISPRGIVSTAASGAFLDVPIWCSNAYRSLPR